MTHTPGPWVNTNLYSDDYYYGGYSVGLGFRKNSPWTFGDVAMCIDKIEDARLIAAAPELLEALENTLEELWGDWHSHMSEETFNDYFKDEIALIKKAKGET